MTGSGYRDATDPTTATDLVDAGDVRARREAEIGVANPFLGLPCRTCGAARLRLEWRTQLVARPRGAWSLVGVQLKTAAVEESWPWCVCDGCGDARPGRRES